MISRNRLTVVAALVLGVALTAPSAMAKCTKDCKIGIKTTFRTCKQACPTSCAGEATKKDKKTCKKTCIKDCKAQKTSLSGSCKSATDPTPPRCGSPSGAFLD